MQLPVRRIAVIGAGMAGREFALRCARAAYDVVLEDVMPDKLRRAQDSYTEWNAPEGGGSLQVATEVENAVRDADLAIDFVPDELESKLEIFSLLDRMAPPGTILLTPTQSLSLADLASCTYRPDRCLALRQTITSGVNSAELIRSSRTSPDVLVATETFLRSLGMNLQIVDDHEEPMLTRNAQRG